MTSRGPQPPIKLPKQDPSLVERPAPRERNFSVLSFGPAAAPDFLERVRPLKDVIPKRKYKNPDWGPTLQQRLLDHVHDNTNMDWRDDGSDVCDPFYPMMETWGPTILITAYSESAQQHLNLAIATLIAAVRLSIHTKTEPKYHTFSQELFHRFRIDVIQDQEALENASVDRVREEFNAHVRSLGLFKQTFPGSRIPVEEEMSSLHDSPERLFNRPDGPGRFDCCIVLDEAKIEELATVHQQRQLPALGEAELESYPKEPRPNQRMLRADWDVLISNQVKVVDRKWLYPEEGNEETSYRFGDTLKAYPGWDMLPINDIPALCNHLEAGNFFLDEMFPLAHSVLFRA